MALEQWGLPASLVEVSMCMKERYLRDDCPVGKHFKPTPCLSLSYFNFAYYHKVCRSLLSYIRSFF